MRTLPCVLAAGLVLALAGAPIRAADRERRTVEDAADAAAAFGDDPIRCIPPTLMRDAAGVAVIPNVVKAGFVVGGRYGRGVVLARGPDGAWTDPIFLTLAGGGVGWQVGVQSTDVILVFKTREGLRRLMEGKDKLTLGGDVAVAAGPIGRNAEAATDGLLKAEIYSYSRTRGLFLGASLEGAALLIDHKAGEDFYGPREAPALSPQDIAEVCRLKDRLMELAGPPPAPVGSPLLFAPEPPLAPPAPMPPPRDRR